LRNEHGAQIAVGDLVVVSMAPANRDPRVFTDPNVLDFDRRMARHLAFSQRVVPVIRVERVGHMHDHVATTSEALNGPGEVPETQYASEVLMADLLIQATVYR
jgi:hypothetical protein